MIDNGCPRSTAFFLRERIPRIPRQVDACCSSRKAPGCSSFFSHVSMGHAHLKSSQICISWEPERVTSVFSNCTTWEKSSKKARLEVCGKSAHLVNFRLKKETHQSIPEHNCNTGFFAFISWIQAALQCNGLFTWVQKDKQMFIHTYVRTNKHTHTLFGKQIQAPGLKLNVYDQFYITLTTINYWQ